MSRNPLPPSGSPRGGERPAVDVAALDDGAAVATAAAALVLLDLGVVWRAKRAQVVESIKRRRLDASRPGVDMVDVSRAAAAAGDGAAIAVTP